MQALWAAAAEADDLRGQLVRSQRAADDAALLDDEDAYAWDALVRAQHTCPARTMDIRTGEAIHNPLLSSHEMTLSAPSATDDER